MDKLEELRKKVEEAIARKQFGDAFQASLKQLIDLVRNAKEALTANQAQELSRIEASLRGAMETFKNETAAEVANVSAKMDETMNKLVFDVESLVSEAQQKIDEVEDGQDGLDADEEAVVEKVLSRIPPQKEYLPPTPEETRDNLEALEGDERLKIEAIAKLREELDRLEESIRTKNIGVGGGHGVGVMDEGVTSNPNATWLNFTGAGVSVSNVGNQTIISITGGGLGSTTPAQESGSITNLTDIVTLAHTPVADTLMLYINEAFVDPSRYSLTGAGKTITMGSALDGSYSGLRFTAIYQY